MLPTNSRLRSSTEIANALKIGEKFTARLVVVSVAKGVADTTKVAFAVGKSVGNSVTRHRIIRRLRHILSSEMHHFPQGSHVVIRALPGTATASFEVLRENVLFALEKVHKHD